MIGTEKGHFVIKNPLTGGKGGGKGQGLGRRNRLLNSPQGA